MFKPESMQHSLNIHWPHEINDEFIFACHTSLITEQMVERKLMKSGYKVKIKDNENQRQS